MTTALLAIDLQDSFRQQASWAQISTPDIVDRVNRLVKHARVTGDVVIWILHEDGDGPFTWASGLVCLQPGLEPAVEELVLRKSSHNAFTTTRLAQELTQRGVTRLRLCGIRTEQCVETTARLGSDLGYEVEVVLDATATHPLPRHEGTGVLSADEVIARTAAALAGRFARIVSIDDVVGS